MKKISVLAAAFFILFMVVATVFAANPDSDKLRLAIIDLQAKGVSRVVGVAVTDLIRSDMVDTGRFTIVERSQMDAILKEQGLQQTGCTDSSCAVQMGKMLSASKVLIGEINQLGQDFIITVRIVDVEKGVADFSTSEKAKDLNSIDQSVKVLVDKLTVRITGKRSLAGETGASDYYLRGIVPGWGQMYAGKTLKGGLYMGGFAAAGAACVYSFFQYKDKKEAYDNLGPKKSESTFDSYYDDYKQSYNVMIYLAGICGLIYAANWVDILFITDSPGVIVSGMPCGAGYIALDLFNRRNLFYHTHRDKNNFDVSYKIIF